MRNDARLSCRYRKAFGAPPSATDDEGVLVDVAKALAAFQETLQSPRAPFDEFRDALARGDRQAAARYPVAAQRGLKVFIASACSTCHTGPNFTNGEFHDTGLPFFAAPGRVDPGRHEGIKQVKEQPLQPAGPVQRRHRARHRDGHPATSLSSTAISASSRCRRCAARPSPRPTLTTASSRPSRTSVRHYSELNLDRLHADGERLLKPLRLTAREQKDLVVFIESLSPYGNSWRPEPGGL